MRCGPTAWACGCGTCRTTIALVRRVLPDRRPRAGVHRAGLETWLSVVHPEDAERVRRAVGADPRQREDYHQQYRVLWPDGSVRWVESQGKCQRDSEGRATRVVGVLADVTNRKLTEEAMLRAEKLAVAGRLAASVAHEINNPLEAVGNLLYLISTAETAEPRAASRQALDELMRVSLITQQTLQFHRQPGTPAVTRLSEVVQRCWRCSGAGCGRRDRGRGAGRAGEGGLLHAQRDAPDLRQPGLAMRSTPCRRADGWWCGCALRAIGATARRRECA